MINMIVVCLIFFYFARILSHKGLHFLLELFKLLVEILYIQAMQIGLYGGQKVWETGELEGPSMEVAMEKYTTH